MTRTAERVALHGTVIESRYRIVTQLGIGGTSVVLDGVRLADGSPVVLKVLRDAFAANPELARRLRREAQVSRRVVHPGLVPVLDEGQLEDGSPYMVMERLEGECVARLLRRQGPLDPRTAAAITLRTASVLHAVHAAGFVHRDVKPEHIMLLGTPDGRLDVRLLDFGVCASSDASDEERASERGRVYGTPAYVSPEQAAGIPEVDGRADVFSLGMCLFQMITGRAPFAATSVGQLLRKIIREDAPRLSSLLPGIDPRFDPLLAQAMARLVDQRFPSARAFGRALVPLVGDRREVERSILARLRSGTTADSLAPTLLDVDARRVA